jgi:hypothetical protein
VEPDWAATLSKSQLAQFEDRLTALGATPADVASVEAYVQHMLTTLGCA